jgi:hypothetical protein
MLLIFIIFIKKKERDHSLVACLQENNPKAETRAQLHHTRFRSCERRLYGLNTNAD